ncbi:MAG: hypothetical protein J5I93_16675, partial [Pirellulaceae bacterium]|nr:hypothetical protein [Pirellulaceae bacterium]
MPEYCPHCHSVLPSARPATGERSRCASCGAWLEPAPPVSYGQQFVHNPLGTYFFGPRLAEYRGSGGVSQAAGRRRHFRRWVYVLLAMFLAAVLLPLLAGLMRRDWELALGGVLVGLLAFFWPALFFLMGMLMYAAAWFEWRWFFRSATLRHARGMFGDSGARSFYLIFGGVLMVGGALFSLGGSLVIAGSFLLVDARPGVAGADPGTPRQRVQVAERTVEQTRQLFEVNARPLRERLDEVQQLRALIRERPHDLELRDQLRDAERRLSKLHADYRLFRDQWQTAVEKLRQRVAETGGSSRVLEQNGQVPPELDFSERDVAVEQAEFPLADVRVATTRLRAGWQNLRQLAEAQPPASPPILERLLSDIEQQRGFLADVERRWRYRSPALEELPPPDELQRVVAAAREVSSETPGVGAPRPVGRLEQIAGPADAGGPRAPSGARREPAAPPT